MKPFWESCQSCLSIRTSPWYLSCTSCLQVFLVILSKTLKPKHKTTHGFICASLIISLCVITAKFKPYNYENANIIQILTLSLSFWVIFISTVFKFINNSVAFETVTLIGLIIIFIIGLVLVSRSKGLLKNSKGVDISTLFIFQFLNNYERYAHGCNSLHFNKSEIKYELPYRSDSMKSEEVGFN